MAASTATATHPPTGTSRQGLGDPIRRLAELLADFHAPVPALLDAVSRDGAVHVSPVEEVVRDGSRGSVLLVGDAAHATSPNTAQGAAMALEDGLVLAECLASAACHPPFGTLLDVP